MIFLKVDYTVCNFRDATNFQLAQIHFSIQTAKSIISVRILRNVQLKLSCTAYSTFYYFCCK